MIKVAGNNPQESVSGIFWMNVVVLVAFWAYGMGNPWMALR